MFIIKEIWILNVKFSDYEIIFNFFNIFLLIIGFVTDSLKIKRREIEKFYVQTINQLYYNWKIIFFIYILSVLYS
jgi:hypothetical protein